MVYKISTRIRVVIIGALLVASGGFSLAGDTVGMKNLNLTIQRRDAAGKVFLEPLAINPAQAAVVVIDMWQHHPCKTMRADEQKLIPQLNRTLTAARRLGMQVVHAPAEVVGYYKDFPQRRAMLDIGQHPLPKAMRSFNPPGMPHGGWCYCGCAAEPPEDCEADWQRWKADKKNRAVRQHRDVYIAAEDMIGKCENGRELYNLCAQRGITHLFYAGIATNMCMFNRGMGMKTMSRYGLPCVILRDLTAAIHGKPFDPTLSSADVTAKSVAVIERWCAGSLDSVQLVKAAGTDTEIVQPLFTPEQVKAYVPKGPSKRFRHFCCDYNLVGGQLEDYLTQADPVKYAQFHQRIHADAALILAVPTHGYTVYETEVGEKFPGLKGDWFARTVDELHKRDISAFAYVALGWHSKWRREHGGNLCYNGPYLDLVVAYSRELLSRYPIDALRYDGLMKHNINCHCDACRSFYHKLYRQPMPARWSDWRQRENFRLATVRRTLQRIHEACKQTKPSVEIWHNGLNIGSAAPLDSFAYVDFSYIEYGHQFGLLFHLNATPSHGMIVGKLESLGHDRMRTCMALGARGYTYIKSRHWDALPPATDSLAQAWRRERGWDKHPSSRANSRSQEEIERLLGRFYKMIGTIEPYLQDAHPVYHNAGIVFCEGTRYRFAGYSRKAYENILRQIVEHYLDRSLPIEFVSNHALPSQDLSRFRLLVLPETTGLKRKELEAIRDYVQGGGQILVVGKGLLYDDEGKQRDDFALADVLGVNYGGVLKAVSQDATNWKQPDAVNLTNEQAWPRGSFAGAIECVHSKSGRTVVSLDDDDAAAKPILLHVNKYGNGRAAYLATSRDVALVNKVIDAMAGPVPVRPKPADKQVILTRQEKQNRWVLHLIGNGDYSVEIDNRPAGPRRIAGQYPGPGWSATLQQTAAGVRIEVSGDAKDRLLILK